MKRLIEKFISTILVIILMLTMAPLSGFIGLELPDLFKISASAATYSGTCGDNLTWTFDAETEELFIDGVGFMENFTSSSSVPWYQYRSLIKKITIENSITSIGKYAFYYCTSLTSVTIPDSVTSIGDYAFYGCTSLTSVTIGNSVASIGALAFNSCTSLTSVTIPDSVTEIGINVFSGCSSLTTVTIPDSVISIGGNSFYRCSSLKRITVDEGNLSYSSDEYGVLYNKNQTRLICFPASNICTSYSIPDTVKNIDSSAFLNCSYLERITVNEGNLSYSSDEYGVLYNKNQTRLIYFPAGNTNINYLFPDSVTSIGDYAFSGCTSLTSVTIPDSVTSIGDSAFDGCSSLASVTIPDSVTSIGDSAFDGCSSLASVTIPDSVTIIGDYAFDGCSSLTSVTIPDSVTSIGDYAFDGCSSLTSVTIPDSVTIIGSSAFRDCTSLTSVTIGNSVTSIGDRAFYGCLNIESIIIGDGVTSLNAFEFTAALKSIVIGNSVTSIGVEAFRDCTSLTSVKIPDSVTSIGAYAFLGCTSLTSVKIPDSVISIGIYAFYGCKSFTSVTIGNSVTSIGGCAFSGCKSLTSVTIGNSVTSIGSSAFSGCPKLADVYYPSSEKEWNNIIIGERNECLLNASFHFMHQHLYSIDKTVPATCTASGYKLLICQCGDSYTENIVALGHSIYFVRQEPSLNQNGYEVYACSVCGLVIQRTILPATGKHNLIVVRQEPTCQNFGTEYSICKDCGNVIGETVILPITNHNYGEWIISVPATCTEDGLRYKECSGCLDRIEETIPRNEHNYKETIVNPTCTEQGYTKHVCERCNDEYIDSYVNSVGHNYSGWQVVTNPTTTSTGLMVRKCSNCDDRIEMSIPILVQNYVTSVELSFDKLVLSLNETASLTATIKPDTAIITGVIWSSSNPDIVSVNNGVLSAKKPGTSIITVKTVDGGFEDYCFVRVNGLKPVAGTYTVIANESSTIYGISANLQSLDGYVDVLDENVNLVFNTETLGTGTSVYLEQKGVQIDSYTIVVFGDVNGDGWYDGQDAVLVSCLANGMLTKDDVSEAVYMAADCNHDGVIDQLDVDLLNQAGTLLANVDQSKPTEVLLETSSEYVEYLDLIDQSPEIKVEDDTDAKSDIPESDNSVENEPIEPDTEDSTQQGSIEIYFVDMIINFIKSIFEMLFAYIPVTIK